MTPVPLLFAIALSACYSPGIESSCTVRCGTGDLCPDGLVCTASNVCAVQGETCSGLRSDASFDSPVDGAICYGHGAAPYLRLCPTFPFPPTLTLPPTIDTAVDCMEVASQGRPGAPDLCVFAGLELTVVGTVTVIGTRPLLLLGAERVLLQSGSVLDVASRRGGRVGAGAPGPGCNAGSGGTNVTSTAGGGGGGGSFGGGGGNGGVGAQAALPGAAGTLPPVEFLRGGCNGGLGGGGGGTQGGTGGQGGGAVYVMARALIQIGGTINASGAGAGAAQADAGGGGGGSGGMIILDADAVEISPDGAVFALGGGGSSGGTVNGGGNPGNDPTGVGQYAGAVLPPSAPAGPGGAGGQPNAGMPGTDAGATGGGGGGGGGGGVIRIWPSTTSMFVDPPAPP